MDTTDDEVHLGRPERDADLDHTDSDHKTMPATDHVDGVPVMPHKEHQGAAPYGSMAVPPGEHADNAPLGARLALRPKKGLSEQGASETAPYGANRNKLKASNVFHLVAPNGAKSQGQGGMPSREQDKAWLKTILPEIKTTGWYDLEENGKGWIIKLRWRVKGDPTKHVYPWRRLGKRDLETLRKQTYEQQRATISSRMFGQLFDEGRRDIAVRLTPYVAVDLRLSAANS